MFLSQFCPKYFPPPSTFSPKYYQVWLENAPLLSIITKNFLEDKEFSKKAHNWDNVQMTRYEDLYFSSAALRILSLHHKIL